MLAEPNIESGANIDACVSPVAEPFVTGTLLMPILYLRAEDVQR